VQKEINWEKAYTVRVRILSHITFWFVVTSIYYLSYRRLDLSLAWFMVLKDIFAVTTIFYITSYIIIPKWLLQGKFLKTFLWFFVIYLWWGWLTYIACLYMDNYLQPGVRLEQYIKLVLTHGVFGIFNWMQLPFYILDFAYLTALPLGLKLMQSLVNKSHQKTLLERDNLALELNFLKSQINPHFLFNTLNNIYRMVNKNDPKTAATVLSLGGLMQYTLYESNFKYVSITNEVKFIKNYLELEWLRYGEKVQIITNIQEDFDEYQIVPLILFPFIENAFKHGPENSRIDAWVKVELTFNESTLKLYVANSYKPGIIKDRKINGGIGLENVTKRLKMNYEGAYTMKVTQKDNSYSTLLEINLGMHNDNLN